MSVMEQIPRDLHDFLARGDTLDYDANDCIAGNVTLCKLEQLGLNLFSVDCDDNNDPNIGGSGCYLVEGVDLICQSDGGYDSEGLLIWLPKDGCYAAWDNSHNKMFVFDKSTTWSEIARSPVRFLNAQWGTDDLTPVSVLRPWINHYHNAQQVHRRFSIPANWIIAEQTLRGLYVKGKQTRTPRKVRIEMKRVHEHMLLDARTSHMNDASDWIDDESVSRPLSQAEQAMLREKALALFWNAGKLEIDFGESVIIWTVEGFDESRYRSICQFYSDSLKPDCISEFGNWLLGLVGFSTLERYLAK